MAVFHLNASILGRSSGGNAVGSAAYRHGTRMVDENTGRTRDYSGKADEVVHEEVALPEDAPEWAKNAYGGDNVKAASERLWNDIEWREDQTRNPEKAQLARSFTIALPKELSVDENVELVRGFVKQNFTSEGMIADWVYHDKPGNPHIHIMTTMRDMAEQGWGNKNRSWNSPKLVTDWRRSWAEHTNAALERAGFDIRINEKSFAELGIELAPVSYNVFEAERVQANGDLTDQRVRAEAAQLQNALYLAKNPEHILTVMAATKPVFSEQEIRDAFAKRMEGMLDKGAVDLAMRMVHRSGELIATGQTGPGDRPLYTSREQVTLESNLTEGALRMARERMELTAAVGSADLVYAEGRFDERVEGLSEDQTRAVEAMINSNRLTLVTGYAGAGKTRAIKAAAQVWQDRGFEVLGTTLPGKAATELATGGVIDAQTLAQFQAKIDDRQLPTEGKFVVFLDEAGMVGAASWAKLQEVVDGLGGKLIAVGDGEQLQPVSDGSAFRSVESQIGSTIIDSVRRQESEVHRAATRGFATGGAGVRLALRSYAKEGAIHWKSGTGSAIADLSRAYLAKEGSKIALAWTNKEVALLNASIRMDAIVRGQVDASSEVTFVQPDRREVEVGAGDRVRFTKSWRDGGVLRGSFGIVESIKGSNLRLRIDGSDKVHDLDTRNFGALDLGYAATIHKAQGMTVDHAMVLASPGMNRHLMYVGMSRHRKSVGLYVPEDRIEDMNALERIALRSGHLELSGLASGDEARMRSAVPAAQEQMEDLSGRADRIAQAAREVVGQPGDDVLVRVSARISGLLQADWQEGMEMFPDGDDRGYAAHPQKIVTDLLARQSVLTASDVAREVSRLTPHPDTFRRLFAEALTHPELLVLAERDGRGGGRVYSTLDHIERELQMADRAGRLALVGAPLHVSHRQIQAALQRDFGRMSLEQENALRHVVGNGKLAFVTGHAGTGKSAMLSGARELFEAKGWDVEGVALSGRAAAELETSSGIKTRSVAALLARVEKGQARLHAKSLIVLDEAGMVDAPTFDRLLQVVEQSGAKLVAVGDPGQLQPLGPGGAFRALVDRVGAAEITEIRRQRRSSDVALVQALAPGGSGASQAVYYAQSGDMIAATGSEEKAHAAILTAWKADPHEDKIVLAHRRRDVHRLNQAIAAIEAGKGEPDAKSVKLLRGDETEIVLRKGTKVVFTRPDRALDVKNGTQGRVVAVDERAGSVSVRVGQGDEARHIKVTREAGPVLDLGYALTVHRAQGMTVDSAHVLVTAGFDRQLSYVAMSRHRDALKIYVPKAKEQAAAWLSNVAGRNRQAASVLDHGFDADQGLGQASKAVPTEQPGFAGAAARLFGGLRGQAAVHMPQLRVSAKGLRADQSALASAMHAITDETDKAATKRLLRGLLAELKPNLGRLTLGASKKGERMMENTATLAAGTATRLQGALQMAGTISKGLLPTDPRQKGPLQRDAFDLLNRLAVETDKINAMPRKEREGHLRKIEDRAEAIAKERAGIKAGRAALRPRGYSLDYLDRWIRNRSLAGMKPDDLAAFNKAAAEAKASFRPDAVSEIERMAALAEQSSDTLTPHQQRLASSLSEALHHHSPLDERVVVQAREQFATRAQQRHAKLDPMDMARNLLLGHTVAEIGALSTADAKLPATLAHIDKDAHARVVLALKGLPAHERGIARILQTARAAHERLFDIGRGIGR